MNKFKYLLPGILICFLFTGTATAQALGTDYRTAIGLRAGETSGVSMKFNTKSNSSIELLAGFWSKWLSLTGLYETKVPAFQINGMNWYYGAGGHVAFETNTYYKGGRNFTRGNDFALGIDGIVGLEYKINQIPFAISIDVKPFMEIYQSGDLYFAIDPGIGVKFTF